ncbi:MAG: hypothetical protein JOZ38_03015 [Candidatus Eremiobacteraeota bacterium]|nr:hypothetical protein [Candidatus Eremiobacteraeota bacterium]
MTRTDSTVRDETSAPAADDQTARDVRDSEREDVDDSFLPDSRMETLRDQWADVQAGFVDDPRSAVQRAQELVRNLVDELTQTFARERETLEGQWDRGGQADTETLRLTLQRYRSFFDRLLQT